MIWKTKLAARTEALGVPLARGESLWIRFADAIEFADVSGPNVAFATLAGEPLAL